MMTNEEANLWVAASSVCQYKKTKNKTKQKTKRIINQQPILVGDICGKHLFNFVGRLKRQRLILQILQANK